MEAYVISSLDPPFQRLRQIHGGGLLLLPQTRGALLSVYLDGQTVMLLFCSFVTAIQAALHGFYISSNE